MSAPQFLKLIEYNVSVTASLYASYYFELRTLCERNDGERDFSIKPLSEAQQRKLELNSAASEEQWKSADPLHCSAPAGA